MVDTFLLAIVLLILAPTLAVMLLYLIPVLALLALAPMLFEIPVIVVITLIVLSVMFPAVMAVALVVIASSVSAFLGLATVGALLICIHRRWRDRDRGAAAWDEEQRGRAATGAAAGQRRLGRVWFDEETGRYYQDRRVVTDSNPHGTYEARVWQGEKGK